MTNLQDAMQRVDNEPSLAAQRPQIWEWLKSEPYRADLIARGDVVDILERVDVRECALWARGRLKELVDSGQGMEAGRILFTERLSKLDTTTAETLRQFAKPTNHFHLAKQSTAELTKEAQRLKRSHTHLDPATGQFVAIKRAETLPERNARTTAEKAANAAQYTGAADFSHMGKLGGL